MDIISRKTFFGIVNCMLFSCAPVYATDLMQIYQLAVDNDAHLQASKYEFQATSEAIDQAIAGLLPDISAEGSHTETEQEIISSDNTVFAGAGSTSFSTETYSITINVPVFRFDSWMRFSQSYEIVKQAKSELLAAQQQLMYDTTEAYFNILAAEDKLDYSQSERKALSSQLELAQEKTNEGLSTEIDLLDIQARYANAESEVVEAESTLDDSYRALQVFTNQFLVDLNILQTGIPLIKPESENIDEWINIAFAQNYTLAAKRYAIEVAKEEKTRQYGGHLPTIDLVGSFNNRNTSGSLFGGGSEVETYDLELRMNVPLFQGGRVLSLTREAKFRLSQAKREYEAERRTLERETRASYQGILSGIKKVTALKKAVTFQLRALESKQESLNAGLNTTLEVLDAQRDLHYVQREHSQARYDYLLNILRLKKSGGTLNPQDLQAFNKLLKVKDTEIN